MTQACICIGREMAIGFFLLNLIGLPLLSWFIIKKLEPEPCVRENDDEANTSSI